MCLGLGVAALAIVFSTLAIVFSTVVSFGMMDLDCDAPALPRSSAPFTRSRRLLTRSRSPTPYGLLPLQTLASLWRPRDHRGFVIRSASFTLYIHR